MRNIDVIRQELNAAKQTHKEFVASVGDDMGCDGSLERATMMRLEIRDLERELAEAKEVL